MNHGAMIPLFASETTDYLAVGISVIAVLVSLLSLAFQLKSSEAMSYTSMLLDLDRLLIDKPELWQIYDRHAPSPAVSTADESGLTAFAYLHFNLFLFLYDVHRSPLRRTLLAAFSSSNWKAERAFMEHFLRESSRARALLAAGIMEDLYPPGFLAFLRGLAPDVRRT